MPSPGRDAGEASLGAPLRGGHRVEGPSDHQQGREAPRRGQRRGHPGRAETIQNGFGSLKQSQVGYTEKIDGIFRGFHEFEIIDLDKFKINEKLKQLKHNWIQVNEYLDGQEK